MNILIIPTIREIYKNQLEYSVDIKLIKLLEKIFSNSRIDVFNDTTNGNYDLIVFSGGNNSNHLKKKDKIRQLIDNKIYNFALKKKIKILGICYGAQYLAKKNGFKIEKNKNHIGTHKIRLHLRKVKLIKTVNSYHDDVIKMNKLKSINVFGIGLDNTVEAFHIREKKILGIMWHPERYSNIKNFDKELIKKFYATNNIISR